MPALPRPLVSPLLTATAARLDAHGIPYRTAEIVPGLTQVFLRDSHGIVLELNFAEQ